MKQDLFNMTFDYWPSLLLSFIPALINVGIFIYVGAFLPPSRMNKTFSLLVLFICITQLLDCFLRMSADREMALAWAKGISELYLFLCPTGLIFALRFVGLHKKIWQPLILLFLFLPAICLEISGICMESFTLAESALWRWVVNPVHSVKSLIYYGWTAGISCITLLVLWISYLKEKDLKRKSQTFFLAAGLSVPFLFGFIFEIIIPSFSQYNGIPTTPASLSIFSIFSIIAMKKYNMLDYSPRHQWETIVDAMKEGLLILDNESRIMYANKEFYEVTGYSEKEIKGRPADQFFPGWINKGPVSGYEELVIKTRSNEKKYMKVSWSPYFDQKGNVVGSINIFTDITSSKQMEMALSRNHERLMKAQQIAHVGSWELNFASGIAIWSEEACRIYGLLPADNAHSFESWLSFIHPEDMAYVQSIIAESGKTKKDSSMRHRIMWRNGTVRHIHSVATFEFNEDGVPVGIFGICHDITEQHQVEQALIESEKRIRSFASHLNDTIENERSYMAREIHDEFGQYMAGIKLGISSLKKQCCGTEATQKRFDGLLADMEACQQSIKRIATKLRPGVLDTLGLIPSMEWLIRDFQKKTDISIDLRIKDGYNKRYDPHTSICFFRICQEALTNISKHAEATCAVIDIAESATGLKLSICDNGKGIATSKLNNPFSTGLLGMRERANLIGAELKITNANGNGTHIQIELKAA